jgi:hypothetical protein
MCYEPSCALTALTPFLFLTLHLPHTSICFIDRPPQLGGMQQLCEVCFPVALCWIVLPFADSLLPASTMNLMLAVKKPYELVLT